MTEISSTDLPLSALLARVALADRRAFQAVYTVSSAQLFGQLLRILKDRRDAEDALQEVYIRVWHRAGSFRADAGSAMAWLRAIARNHALDRLRARRSGVISDEVLPEMESHEPTPEEAAMTASDGRRIDACLTELDPERALAVRAAYVEGESYIELAERFNVPLNTMRSWLRRSLLALRECLTR